MAHSSETLKADAVLLGLTALWGVTFVAVKDALADAEAFTFISLRFALGAAAAWVMVALRRRAPTEPMIDRGTVKAGLFLGVLLFIGFAFQTTGLEHTTPSRSAFITGLCVLAVPLVSLLVFGRRPRAPSLIGVLLAVIGMYVLTGFGAVVSAANTLLGDGLTLGCALAFAVHIVYTEKLAAHRPATTLVAVQLVAVAALATACLPLVKAQVSWNASFALALVFCGVVASAFAIVLQTWGQARTTAVRAALIFAIEPVFAAAFSAAMGRESLGWREVGGGGLIVVGVIASEIGNALLDSRSRILETRG